MTARSEPVAGSAIGAPAASTYPPAAPGTAYATRSDWSPSARASARWSASPCMLRRSSSRSARPCRARRERSWPNRNAAGTVISEESVIQSSVSERAPVTKSLTSSETNISIAKPPAMLGSIARRRAFEDAFQRSASTAVSASAAITHSTRCDLSIAFSSHGLWKIARTLSGCSCQNSIQTNCSTTSGSANAATSAQSTRPCIRPAVRNVSTSGTNASVQKSVVRYASVWKNGTWIWLSSGNRRNPAPVAVISSPVRLSGRWCQAISPQPANEPPTSLYTTSDAGTGSLGHSTGISATNSATPSSAHIAPQNHGPRAGTANRLSSAGRATGFGTRSLARSAQVGDQRIIGRSSPSVQNPDPNPAVRGAGDLSARAQACRPHSDLPVPAQRPSRPAPGTVQCVQPIVG